MLGIFFGVWFGSGVIMGAITGSIASARFRSGGFFFVGFFFGLIGVLVVGIGLQDWRPSIRKAGIEVFNDKERNIELYYYNDQHISRAYAKQIVAEYMTDNIHNNQTPFYQETSIANQDTANQTLETKLDMYQELSKNNKITKTEYNNLRKKAIDQE